eukprot:1498125-Heterocapsa_arctica.AAC.1
MAAGSAGCRGGSELLDGAGEDAPAPELLGGRAWGRMSVPLFASGADAPESAGSRHPVALP